MSNPPFRRHRINFKSTSAARFNVMRDAWRDQAMQMKPIKSALQVIPLIASHVSREFGYAWPTDQQIADTIGCSTKTVWRGINWLDQAGLIERLTRPKRNEKREVEGRERRIFLTIPAEVNGQVAGSEWTPHAEVNGQVAETPEIPAPFNERDRSMSAAGSEWTKGRGEPTTGGEIYLTPTSVVSNTELDSYYARTRGEVPAPFTGDIEFINAFDRELVRVTTGKPTDQPDIETVVQKAFDSATESDPTFMPLDWQSVCRLYSDDAKGWFLNRAATVVHVRSAS